MKRMKYRFWFFSVCPLSRSSYCAKLWVHSSIFMTQTLDYVWGFSLFIPLVYRWVGLHIIYHNKREQSNFFNSAVYACKIVSSMLITHKARSNAAQLFRQTEHVAFPPALQQYAGWNKFSILICWFYYVSCMKKVGHLSKLFIMTPLSIILVCTVNISHCLVWSTETLGWGFENVTWLKLLFVRW